MGDAGRGRRRPGRAVDARDPRRAPGSTLRPPARPCARSCCRAWSTPWPRWTRSRSCSTTSIASPARRTRETIAWFVEPPAGERPARALDPHRPRAAARHSARPRPAARAARGRAALHRRRGGRVPQPAARPGPRRRRRRPARRPHRGLAGRHLPGRAVAGGHGGQARARDRVRRHERPRRRLPRRRGARRPLAGAAALHAAHVGARAPVRAAVRRRARTTAARPARWTSLARTNLFLLPLDDRRRWFRFHHLFAQILRVELEKREPELVPGLHRRAFEWHREFGTTDEAIHHAVAAQAFPEASRADHRDVGALRQRRPDRVGQRVAGPRPRRRRPAPAAHPRVGGRRCAEARPTCAPRPPARARSAASTDGPLPDGFVSVESSLSRARGDLRLGRRVRDPLPRRPLGAARAAGLALAAGDHVGARLGALLQRRPRPGRTLAERDDRDRPGGRAVDRRRRRDRRPLADRGHARAPRRAVATRRGGG